MISCLECNSIDDYIMNGIVYKFLFLSGDKCKPEMYLKQLGFTYGAYWPFTKKKVFKNLKKQEIQDIFTKMN